MNKIRIGVQVHPQQATYTSYADAVRRVEAMGVDTIWNWDHFFPLYGDRNGDHFEAWTLLTAMAAITQRAEIGCLVTCNGYRNPALLSNMAKTLDHISGGRLILGIGAGWNRRDYREYGYEFGTAGTRIQMLGEALPVIKKHWQVDVPPPVRNPIPILIGGGGERLTLKIVAEHADIWNVLGTPDEFRHKSEVLDHWCQEVGRDARAIERSIAFDADQLSQLDAYWEAGATHFIMGLGYPWNFETVERLVGWRERQ